MSTPVDPDTKSDLEMFATVICDILETNRLMLAELKEIKALLAKPAAQPVVTRPSAVPGPGRQGSNWSTEPETEAQPLSEKEILALRANRPAKGKSEKGEL